jgi:hypothetical protein
MEFLAKTGSMVRGSPIRDYPAIFLTRQYKSNQALIMEIFINRPADAGKKEITLGPDQLELFSMVNILIDNQTSSIRRDISCETFGHKEMPPFILALHPKWNVHLIAFMVSSGTGIPLFEIFKHSLFSRNGKLLIEDYL